MIQFIAYRGTSMVSWLIRWQTRSCYSHIALRFTEDLWVQMGDGREKRIGAGNVIEAWQTGGVALHGHAGTVHTPGTRVDVFEYAQDLSLTEAQVMAGFLVRQLGKAYDFMGVARFLTREPVDHWRRNKWFCSELAFEMALTGGRPLLARCAAWEVPPRDVPRSTALKLVGQEKTK